MRYISFCSGIEAATAAWHSLDWTPLAFCEIDKAPSRILAHHYPDVPNLGDFTAVDWSAWTGMADICVGGTPCQAFSVAGLRKSLSDERGNLSLEFIRAINIIRPRFVVWENVPGVLSTADNAFGCFLAGLVGCEEPIVFESGWPNAGVVDGPLRRCAWRVLDAQYFGLAQRRKRVFVIASSGDGPHPAEILFEWESMRRDSPPSRESGENTTGTIAARTRGGGGLGTDFDCDGGVIGLELSNQGAGGNVGWHGEDAPFRTLGTGGAPGVAIQLPDVVGPLVSSHTPNGHGCAGVNNQDVLSGHIIPSEDGTGRGTPLVVGTLTGNGDAHSGFKDENGLVAVANSLNGNAGRMQIEATYVSCMSSQLGSHVEMAPTLRSEPAGLGYPTAIGMAVRRLTPREAERLQGFDDDYTALPGMADGPRYKALGNSFAVPVVRWLGERIQASAVKHGK